MVRFLLFALVAATVHGAPLDEIQQLPLKPRETAQQMPYFPDQAEIKQKTERLLEKDLQQETKPDLLDKEELKTETEISPKLLDLKPELAANEDFEPETKPSIQDRELSGVEEGFVPETKPVQRSQGTEKNIEEEEEGLSPRTKQGQRSSGSELETRPSPKLNFQRPMPEAFEHPQQRFIPKPVQPVQLGGPKENKEGTVDEV